jgi:hypothetical protein
MDDLRSLEGQFFPSACFIAENRSVSRLVVYLMAQRLSHRFPTAAKKHCCAQFYVLSLLLARMSNPTVYVQQFKQICGECALTRRYQDHESSLFGCKWLIDAFDTIKICNSKNPDFS